MSIFVTQFPFVQVSLRTILRDSRAPYCVDIGANKTNLLTLNVSFDYFSEPFTEHVCKL
jgi:hypothetical protein